MMMDDGPKFKDHRRMIAQGMGSKLVVGRYVPMLEKRTRQLVMRLLGSPGWENLEAHVRRCISLP
jgi:cytochrome P450